MREGQGYPCWLHNMMMMMILKRKLTIRNRIASRRLFSHRHGMINHIISECRKTAQKEYKTRYDCGG